MVGLIVNLVGLWLLRSRSKENLNIQGAFYEVAKDALGSIGIIIASAVIVTTGFTLIDPVVSALIALFVLPRTWKLMSDAVNILLESTPADISIGKVKQMMLDVDGVDTVHDLHIWTITSGMDVMSGHIVLQEDVDLERAQEILTRINSRLKGRYRAYHLTGGIPGY